MKQAFCPQAPKQCIMHWTTGYVLATTTTPHAWNSKQDSASDPLHDDIYIAIKLLHKIRATACSHR